MTVRPASARSPGEAILETHGLTKRFGEIVAVDQLDLEVLAGEVHGFLGPNGSGKSTTVGMIMGLIRPTSGGLTLFGEESGSRDAGLRRRVGAIIENPAFYPYLSGRDNLRAIAMAAGGVPARRIDELLEQVGLHARRDSAYHTYSLGMKQRLGIASTMLTDPDLIILDEPTNGLDPAGQREVRELIPRLAHEGRGVLLASHLLHEVEQVCDRVTIIRSGRVVESGVVEQLLRRGSFLEVGVSDKQGALTIVRDLPFVDTAWLHDGAIAVQVSLDRGEDINRALVEHGIYAHRIVPHVSSLEDVFLELTGSGTESEAAHDRAAS